MFNFRHNSNFVRTSMQEFVAVHALPTETPLYSLGMTDVIKFFPQLKHDFVLTAFCQLKYRGFEISSLIWKSYLQMGTLWLLWKLRQETTERQLLADPPTRRISTIWIQLMLHSVDALCYHVSSSTRTPLLINITFLLIIIRTHFLFVGLQSSSNMFITIKIIFLKISTK
jgi:hypothetical protein